MASEKATPVVSGTDGSLRGGTEVSNTSWLPVDAVGAAVGENACNHTFELGQTVPSQPGSTAEKAPRLCCMQRQPSNGGELPDNQDLVGQAA